MADITVGLKWTGQGLEFDGATPTATNIRLDGNKATGASPMEALLHALAGCMAADIVGIAEKQRVTMTGLEIEVAGDRAAEFPRRYTRIAMTITARGAGPADEAKLQRAVDLSRDTYCSVLHSLRQDIEMDFGLVLG